MVFGSEAIQWPTWIRVVGPSGPSSRQWSKSRELERATRKPSGTATASPTGGVRPQPETMKLSVTSGPGLAKAICIWYELDCQ